jgi:fructoselysine and glucoselysine-specific PTS system IIC component
VAFDGATVLWLAERAVVVAFVGALIGLDHIAVGQFMVAQPVVGAVAVAWLVGEPLLGVWSALTFQLLWAGQLPVGAYVPPNVAITAIAAVGIAAPGPLPFPARMVLAAALAVPVGVVAGRLDVWVKSRNIGVLHRAENDVLDGRPFALGGAVVRGIVRFFLKDFCVLLAAVFLGAALVTAAAPFITARAVKGLSYAFAVMPAVGVASALRMYGKKNAVAAFAAGAVVAAVALVAITFAR